MLVNIIGLGKVGATLAKLFVDNAIAEIAGVYNRSEDNGLQGIKFIGQGEYYNSITSLPKADITFITTTDEVISSISAEYATNCNLQAGSIVVHCSGTLAASCMEVLRNKGCHICSIHPMHSFADPNISVQKFVGTYCAIEGDKLALDLVSSLFIAIGAKVINVASNNKPLYHAAGVFASNYLLTLAEQALNCLHFAQVKEDDALGLLINIMHNTMSNLAVKKSPSAALTGPLKRGDFATIEAHVSAFTDEQSRDFYKFLLEKTKDLVT